MPPLAFYNSKLKFLILPDTYSVSAKQKHPAGDIDAAPGSLATESERNICSPQNEGVDDQDAAELLLPRSAMGCWGES